MRHAVAFSLMLGLALPTVHSLAAEPVLEQVLLSTSGVGYLRKMLDVVLFPEIWKLRTDL